MSSVNTNGINVNFPIAGNNNNSQGFRDNFASIKNNLNTVGTEITDLQNTVVVKTALANTTLNNDMGNTLISNAAIRNFRSTTYNLGGSLSGTVNVDVELGDVQYGIISGDTTFTFCCWGPTDTQCNVELQLTFSAANAVITFPPQVVLSNNNFGITTIENYVNVGGNPTITAPSGVSQINIMCSTLNCGQTIYVAPINRPRIMTQIQQRSPAPTGYQGDVAGTVSIDPGTEQLMIGWTYSDDSIELVYYTTTTAQLYIGMPIVFTGVAFGGIEVGTTYYVASIVNDTIFSISDTPGGANLTLTDGGDGSMGAFRASPVTNMYVCVGMYNSSEIATYATATYSSDGNITLDDTSSLILNAPIVFSNPVADANVDTKMNANITANQVYYVQQIDSPNIAISATRVAGIAGGPIPLFDWASVDTAPGNVIYVVSYNGSDIWKNIPLTSW